MLGPAELREDVLDSGLCIGCGACVSLCPYFKSHNGATVMLFPCAETDGRCFAYCPKTEVDLDGISEYIFGATYDAGPLGSYRDVKISRAGAGMKRGEFQSGGTVSALMTYALEKKMVDAAVLTDRDGLLPVPRIVTRPDEVVHCASSKYAAAPTLSAFNEAVRAGYTKIGVVATPCQVMALAQMRRNPLELDGFTDPTALVIGLFCTWSLDYRELRTFLAGRIDIATIRKIDIPPPPADVMEIYSDTAKIDIPLSEIRELVPGSCDYCFDMTSEFADISVGVLEGNPSMNTLVVRTSRGENLVHAAIKDGYLEVSDIPSENLEHLRAAAGNKKLRAMKKAEAAGLINTGKGGRALLRLAGATVSEIID